MESSTNSPSRPASWPGYVVPMALFVLLTAVEGQVAPSLYVWLYMAKVSAVTLALLLFRDGWRDIRWEARVLPLAITVGLAVFAEWILLDRAIPYPHLGKRTALNPFLTLTDPGVRGLFLAFRFFGLVLLVPVVEELFWRSFLLRYFTRPDFTALPMGTFSWSAFAMVAGAFGLAHPEWLVAVICAVAYGLLLRQTRSLFACVVAHAVTNLALGIYVLVSHNWIYW